MDYNTTLAICLSVMTTLVVTLAYRLLKLERNFDKTDADVDGAYLLLKNLLAMDTKFDDELRGVYEQLGYLMEMDSKLQHRVIHLEKSLEVTKERDRFFSSSLETIRQLLEIQDARVVNLSDFVINKRS